MKEKLENGNGVVHILENGKSHLQENGINGSYKQIHENGTPKQIHQNGTNGTAKSYEHAHENGNGTSASYNRAFDHVTLDHVHENGRTGLYNHAFEHDTPDKKDSGENGVSGSYKNGHGNGSLVRRSSSKLPTDDEKEENLKKLTLKDNGYAWLVLVAMVVSNILTVGFVRVFGIVFIAISKVYPNTSGTMSGLIFGLLAGFRTIMAPIAGAMANTMGVRKLMCLGTFLYSFSLFVSFFCTEVWQLAITLGTMIGMSYCFIENCQVVVVSEYFESKLPFANGIRVSGNPFGGIFFSFFITILLQYYGLKLLFIILAGLTTHIFLCSALMRPVKLHTRIKALDAVSAISKHRTQLGQKPLDVDERKATFQDIMNQNLDATQAKKKKPLELRMLKNKSYIFFLLMAACMPLGLPLIMYYTTLYAESVVKLSPYELSVLVAYQAGLDFVFRIFLGWLNNKNLYKHTHGYIFCLWCCALGSFLTPLATNVWFLVVTVTLFTLGPCGFHCFVNVILCDRFGKELIATTWSFLRMVQGIFSFIHPTFIGFLLDWSGSFTAPFVVMGTGMFFCGLIFVIEILILKVQKVHRKDASKQNGCAKSDADISSATEQGSVREQPV